MPSPGEWVQEGILSPYPQDSAGSRVAVAMRRVSIEGVNRSQGSAGRKEAARRMGDQACDLCLLP